MCPDRSVCMNCALISAESAGRVYVSTQITWYKKIYKSLFDEGWELFWDYPQANQQ